MRVKFSPCVQLVIRFDNLFQKVSSNLCPDCKASILCCLKSFLRECLGLISS